MADYVETMEEMLERIRKDIERVPKYMRDLDHAWRRRRYAYRNEPSQTPKDGTHDRTTDPVR